MQCGESTNVAASSSSPMEDMDFLGNGSMMDLAMKMGDLDRVLDEISQIGTNVQTSPTTKSAEKVGGRITDAHEVNSGTDNKTRRKSNLSRDEVIAEVRPGHSFDDSATTDLSDDEIVDDSDVGTGGLAEMQAELMQAELRAKECRPKQEGGSPVSTSVSTNETSKTTGRLITAIAIKPSQDCPVGIRMKTSNGVTMIVGILETGLLRDSDLRTGMELVSVNGVPIKNAKHAKYLIQGSSTSVKIVAMEYNVCTTTQKK